MAGGVSAGTKEVLEPAITNGLEKETSKQLFTAALWDTNLLKNRIYVMMQQMSAHALLLDQPKQSQTTALKMHVSTCEVLR